MTDYEKTVGPLKALASRSRLQILECMQKGISNPSDIAKAVGLEPTTVGQHLKKLLASGIIERITSHAESGTLTVHYRIRNNAKDELLASIQEIL